MADKASAEAEAASKGLIRGWCRGFAVFLPLPFVLEATLREVLKKETAWWHGWSNARPRDFKLWWLRVVVDVTGTEGLLPSNGKSLGCSEMMLTFHEISINK